MPDRPNCYACRYRRGVPGDAHSECVHPAGGLEGGIVFMVAAMAALRQRPPPDEVAVRIAAEPELSLAFSIHGIAQGWATWPLNFDPVWLRACTGFTPKEAPQ